MTCILLMYLNNKIYTRINHYNDIHIDSNLALYQFYHINIRSKVKYTLLEFLNLGKFKMNSKF